MPNGTLRQKQYKSFLPTHDRPMRVLLVWMCAVRCTWDGVRRSAVCRRTNTVVPGPCKRDAAKHGIVRVDNEDRLERGVHQRGESAHGNVGMMRFTSTMRMTLLLIHRGLTESGVTNADTPTQPQQPRAEMSTLITQQYKAPSILSPSSH